MKKIITVFLAAVLSLSMIGCGSGGNSGDSTGSTGDATVKNEEEEEEYSEFNWPKSDIAKLLPEPKSNIGKVQWEGSDGFVIYVAETPKDDYSDYVDACQEKGFTVDYSKSDSSFYADNDDGYHVSVVFNDGDVMCINMSAPEEEEATEEEPEETEEAEEKEKKKDSEKSSKNDSSKKNEGLDEDFKEAMDSYEEFFDEYVEFMKKYEDSDDAVGMLGDLSEYMSKYTDMMEKLDDLDEDEMTPAELEYYTEVMGRINKKLAELS